MKINIKATKLDLTPAIKEYIEIKIGSVSHFIKRFESGGEAEISVEIARTTKHHHKGDVFYAEANLKLPKKTIRAEHSDFDIRVAIDNVKKILKEEVSKYKEKVVGR